MSDTEDFFPDVQEPKTAFARIYFNIAHEAHSNLAKILTESKVVTDRIRKEKLNGLNALTLILPIAKRRRTAILTTVVFAALAAESAVNYALDANLGDDMFQTLDKLSPPDKLKALARFAFEEDLARGREPLQSAIILNKLRITVVHDKPQHIHDKDGNYHNAADGVDRDDALRAFRALDTVIRYIHDNDQDFAAWWGQLEAPPASR